jgi:MFS family permease
MFKRSENAWILVGALALIYLINIGFPTYGGSIANTYMSEALGMSKSSLGAGFSLFTLFQGVSGVAVLLSIQRLGVKRTLLVGTLMILAGSLLMRFGVTESWQYVVVYGGLIGLGTGFGAILPITTSITLWFEKRRALAMSVVLAAGGMGGLVSSPLVDRIVTSTERGWQAGWELVALVAVVSFLIALVFVRDKPGDAGGTDEIEPISVADGSQVGAGLARTARVYRTPRDWKTADALRSRALWLFSIGSLAFGAPFWLCVAHSASHLRDLGVSPSTASLALGLLTAFSIAGRLLAGSLGDRIEPRFLWAGALILLAAGCLAILQARTVAAIVLYACLVGMGFGVAYVCRAVTVGNYFGASVFASINGILGSLLTVFMAAVPWIAGMIRDTQGSYGPAFVGIAVFSLVGSLCLLAIREPKVSLLAETGQVSE